MTTSERPAAGSARRPRLNTETVAVGALFVAVFAFLAAIFAVALAARAVDEHRAVAALIRSGGSGGGTPVPISGREFRFEPAAVQVPFGGTLDVTNDGAVVHNLRVVDGPATPMLASGESAPLRLDGLLPGSYRLICEVPGHEAAGMTGDLTIS